jgi:putative membrane protein
MVVLGERSWLRLLFVVRGTPLSRIWRRLLAVMVVATAVTVAHERYQVLRTDLTTVPFTLVGLALGIFLGFRNNASYDRFWEGRRLWGQLINTARTLTRQMMTLVRPGDDDLAALHRELVSRVIGFAHALRHHLRGEEPLGDAAVFFPEAERAALLVEKNVPNAVVHRLAERLSELWRAGRIDVPHMRIFDVSLTSFSDIQGGCERIKNTPLPASYTILIHRLVASYCFALPFGLVGSIALYTPVVVLLVSYAFMGLDSIGDEIEEPFGSDDADLPLTALCRVVEIDLRQRLGQSDLPVPLEPVDGVLL